MGVSRGGCRFYRSSLGAFFMPFLGSEILGVIVGLCIEAAAVAVRSIGLLGSDFFGIDVDGDVDVAGSGGACWTLTSGVFDSCSFSSSLFFRFLKMISSISRASSLSISSISSLTCFLLNFIFSLPTNSSICKHE